MTSLVLGDLILESLTPSVNAPLLVTFRKHIRVSVTSRLCTELHSDIAKPVCLHALRGSSENSAEFSLVLAPSSRQIFQRNCRLWICIEFPWF